MILVGDCRAHMQDKINPKSVHCVCSSPPYWGGIRDYQIPELTWSDGWVGDFGNEPTIEMYLAHTLEIFEGLKQVLRDDGVIFWNIGDTYSAGSRTGPQVHQGHLGKQRFNGGLSEGNKCLVPHRVAIALQAAGWIVRQDNVWSKPSPMPESVNGVRWERCREKIENGSVSKRIATNGTVLERNAVSEKNGHHLAQYVNCPGCEKCEANDGYVLLRWSWRSTTSHEYIFQITKSNDYFCDADAVKEATSGTAHYRGNGINPKCVDGIIGSEKQNGSFSSAVNEVVESRNPRSVWSISSESYRGSHFAAYPSKLVHKCLKAGVSQHGCCDQCGACFAPIIEKTRVATRPGTDSKVWKQDEASEADGVRSKSSPNRDPYRHIQISNANGYRPTCQCHNPQPIPCTVYDPFGGSGTTGQVAKWMGLNFLLSELGAQYVPLIEERLKTTPRCAPKPYKPRIENLPNQMTMFTEEA